MTFDFAWELAWAQQQHAAQQKIQQRTGIAMTIRTDITITAISQPARAPESRQLDWQRYPPAVVTSRVMPQISPDSIQDAFAWALPSLLKVHVRSQSQPSG
jgi:hypothetical protein